jgi:hypothetical protein
MDDQDSIEPRQLSADADRLVVGMRNDDRELAPSYDFTAPDRGPLLHDGEEWRQAARAALAELNLAKPGLP